MKYLNKKGQGMGLKLVIIAVLLLIIVAVMLMLGGQGQETIQKGTMCEPNNGVCMSRAGCDIKLLGFKCASEGDVCCGDV